MVKRSTTALVLGLLCGLIGCDRPADQDQIVRESTPKTTRQPEVEHPTEPEPKRPTEAERQAEADRQRKAAEAREKERIAAAATLEEQVDDSLFAVADAYLDACDDLGRPPKNTEELNTRRSLVSPRDGKPFEIAWGAGDNPGTLLAWESTTGGDGGRWIAVAAGRPRRATAEEFQAMRAADAAPKYEIRPAAELEPLVGEWMFSQKTEKGWQVVMRVNISIRQKKVGPGNPADFPHGVIALDYSFSGPGSTMWGDTHTDVVRPVKLGDQNLLYCLDQLTFRDAEQYAKLLEKDPEDAVFLRSRLRPLLPGPATCIPYRIEGGNLLMKLGRDNTLLPSSVRKEKIDMDGEVVWTRAKASP